MATSETIKSGLKGTEIVKQDKLEVLISNASVKKRFEDIMGKKAPAFISSIISATKSNPKLSACEPMSVLSSAVIAATLDLPINSNLGFSAIVPYGGKAQFQVMWRGYVQLAIRTGQYKTMNASEVYEGELKSWNRITGELELDMAGKKSDKVVGFVSFFKLINGFEKYMYMTLDEVKAHGRRYSKSFDMDSGQWKMNFNSMALKTVLKMLLSKYGILSVEMQKAIAVDQAIITPTATGGHVANFEDNPEESKAIPVEEIGGDYPEEMIKK